jgi:hypothetical protein
LKISIISNYLFPERGAAPNRITSLAQELGKNNEVEVVAPLPNYPTGKIFKDYRRKIFVKEDLGGFIGRRYWSYNSNSSNSIKRGLAMFSFGFMMFFECFNFYKKKPEIVIIQNSPLLVSFFGIFYCKLFTKAKIVLNVSDLWPLSALELNVLKKGMFYSFLERIELYNYRNSSLILGQSDEILSHVLNYYPNKNTFLYRNFPKIFPSQKYRKKNDELRIVYAGLLGVAQGVLEICNNIDFEMLGIQFDIYGAGNEEAQILELSKRKKNITFKGSVNVNQLREYLSDYDFSIVPLKNPIYGAVPSKIFELSLLGIPMFFSGGGEGADIIKKYGLGFTSFPGDFNSLSQNLLKAKNLKNEEYQILVNNCIETSKVHFDFDYQLKRLEYQLQKITKNEKG